MIFSKHNIFSRIRNSDKFFIINLLTGKADILDHNEAQQIQRWLKNVSQMSLELFKSLVSKKYIITPDEERKLYTSKYLEFLDSRDVDEVQLFFVSTYACNFACTYCYQDEYNYKSSNLAQEVIDSFFNYIKNEFAGRRKYVTLFGGEPLLNSEKQKSFVEHFIEKANQHGLEISIVSNGYTLDEYMPILTKAKIREIQVTLDGTAETHNKRRKLKVGGSSFEKICSGIDSCIKNKLTINLRIVIDKENIYNLPELADYSIKKGWTKSEYFKTQIGRNYELHHCQSAPALLFSRIEMYENIYNLCKEHPQILEFYKPAYSISKFLYENGTLPSPLFDSCPACKTEWAFDYTGNIYPCTATVGKNDESLGTFYPVITKKESLKKEWEKGDVLNIDRCKECNVQLACGGGCGAVSKNKTGNISSPDCRPVKELLELGISQYILNNN